MAGEEALSASAWVIQIPDRLVPTLNATSLITRPASSSAIALRPATMVAGNRQGHGRRVQCAARRVQPHPAAPPSRRSRISRNPWPEHVVSPVHGRCSAAQGAGALYGR